MARELTIGRLKELLENYLDEDLPVRIVLDQRFPRGYAVRGLSDDDLANPSSVYLVTGTDLGMVDDSLIESAGR